MPEALLQGSVRRRIDPWRPFCIQAMRTKLGHPSSPMRFRSRTATCPLVARRLSVVGE